jgi:hypothetical protein
MKFRFSLFAVVILACSEESPIPAIKLECLVSVEQQNNRTIDYTYNQSRLSRIVYKDQQGTFIDFRHSFEYSGNTVKMYEAEPSGQNRRMLKEFFFSQGRLIRMKHYLETSVTTCLFSYDTDQIITILTRGEDLQGNSFSDYDSIVYSLDTQGNIVDNKVYNGITKRIKSNIVYTFDEGKNPKKENLICFVSPDLYSNFVFYFNTNNPASLTNLNFRTPRNYSYSNEYNAQNFLIRTSSSASPHEIVEFSYRNCN